MKAFKQYTVEDIKIAVKESISIAEVLKKLKLKAAGGNYLTFQNWVKKYNIDTSHFLGRGYLKNKTHKYKFRKLEDILVYGRCEPSNRLKKRLIQEGYKEFKCEKCFLSSWNDQDISLELHHKDGDRWNNQLSNLEILCPNCHAQTDNYRTKKKK